MAQWGELAKNRTMEWDKPVNQTGYLDELAEYWDRVGKGQSAESINKDIGHRGWGKKDLEKSKAKHVKTTAG